MGVDLKDLVPKKPLSLDELSGKSIAIDAHNALYQFLAIIRQPTGELLTDKQGRVTSHLSGILYRNSNLLEKGVKLVYVFDGKPPSKKTEEIRRRTEVKRQAETKYIAAVAAGDFVQARSYAMMTSRLEDYMVADAMRLLGLMGIPCVRAPSEGEAQAAHMSLKQDVWATGSQDYDSLLFGAPRLARNLAITGRRKLPRRNVYVEVNPEMVELDEVLRTLQITRQQLIDTGILIGTDFNPDGIRGIGPKTALKLIKQHQNLEKAVSEIPAASYLSDQLSIRDIFLKPDVTDDYRLEWKSADVEGVVQFLCGERDFSVERVRNAMDKISESYRNQAQKKTLESWF